MGEVVKHKNGRCCVRKIHNTLESFQGREDCFEVYRSSRTNFCWRPEYEGGKGYFREPWITCFIPREFYSSWNVILVIAVSRDVWK